MPDPQKSSPKRSPIAARPRRCRQFGKEEVVLATTEYDAEVNHDGRLHAFRIPKLKLPVCQACGARVFTEHADSQINSAYRQLLERGELGCEEIGSDET